MKQKHFWSLRKFYLGCLLSAITETHTHTFPYTLFSSSLSLSNTHTHTPTCAHAHTNKQANSYTLSVSLSLSLTHIHTQVHMVFSIWCGKRYFSNEVFEKHLERLLTSFHTFSEYTASDNPLQQVISQSENKIFFFHFRIKFRFGKMTKSKITRFDFFCYYTVQKLFLNLFMGDKIRTFLDDKVWIDMFSSII
jgi:hypothetical protein